MSENASAKKWISVREALPEPFTTVIVCRPGMDEPIVEQGRRTGDGWWKVYGTRTKAVTHWMLMPMAPDNDDEPSFLDKIRNMSDEELVQMFINTELSDRIPFCKNLKTCDPDVEGSITDEKCAVCLLEYLQRPAREFEMFKEE